MWFVVGPGRDGGLNGGLRAQAWVWDLKVLETPLADRLDDAGMEHVFRIQASSVCASLNLELISSIQRLSGIGPPKGTNEERSLSPRCYGLSRLDTHLGLSKKKTWYAAEAVAVPG